jgi:hypothetical protein
VTFHVVADQGVLRRFTRSRAELVQCLDHQIIGARAWSTPCSTGCIPWSAWVGHMCRCEGFVGA